MGLPPFFSGANIVILLVRPGVNQIPFDDVLNNFWNEFGQ
jgi:hypothetical protein